MQKILGKEISQTIIERLKAKPVPNKIFAAILVADDPASVNFVGQKEKLAKSLGIDFRIYRLSPELKNDGLRKEVREIAQKKRVGGVIVQLPLPRGVNRHYVMNTIPPEKDVDVLGKRASDEFYGNHSSILPPAVGTVATIIESSSLISNLSSLRVAMIGAGLLVGKPVAHWLKGKAKEITIFRSTSKDMEEKLKNYDIVISGVGKANLFNAEHVKENAIVIDFGWDTVNGKICGDFNPSTQLPITNYQLLNYTPTPGGTGPILVAKLLENFYTLAERQ